jgi:hypothetical protein
MSSSLPVRFEIRERNMADEKDVDETTTQDNEQELGDFLGVDPIYMNYSDERNKPYRADADEADDEVVATEEVAYAHQEWTRDDAGQDPTTGEPLDLDPAEELKRKRAQYADPNWRPNVPTAMTAAATGTTEQVNADGTTGEPAPAQGTTQTDAKANADSAKSTTTAPTVPTAPKAAAKKTASSSGNK